MKNSKTCTELLTTCNKDFLKVLMSPVHTKNRGWKQTSWSEISTLPSEFISEENTSTNVWPITQHAAQSSAPEGKALLGSSVARLRLRRFLKYSIFILWTLHPVRLASSSAFPGIRWDTDRVQMFAFNKDLLNLSRFYLSTSLCITVLWAHSSTSCMVTSERPA